MMKRAKRPEAGRIACLVGETETDAYIAIHAANTAFVRRTGDRYFGGGGIVLLDPKDVSELRGDFRPGLVAFAQESAGDWLCWDLRKGRRADGPPPRVVYVDHELGLATPFARGVQGALVHLLAVALVGAPTDELAPFAAAWVAEFGPVVGPTEKALIVSFAERVARRGKRPVFKRLEEAAQAVSALVPKGESDWGMLPPTHVPLLSPDDAKCVDEAIGLSETAVKETADFLNRTPPHVLGEHADRVARLASQKRRPKVRSGVVSQRRRT